VIWTIRLPPADVDEADALRTVDEKRGRPSDVERRQAKAVIDAVAPDHRPIWVDEQRKAGIMTAGILRHFIGALAHDNQDLSPEPMILR
jgi:hypothetical protein